MCVGIGEWIGFLVGYCDYSRGFGEMGKSRVRGLVVRELGFTLCAIFMQRLIFYEIQPIHEVAFQ